ncbi:MAG: hypothetical protein NC485_14520 [Ruminococcus flavefaciens]|nr:hypothetical protein [Ruminococcus flavefaciens]
MQVDGAIIKEQGVTFSIIIVKPHVLNNNTEANAFRNAMSSVFPSPIILMAQDSRGVPKYHGRPDIVKFLARVHPSRIPWKRYTVN